MLASGVSKLTILYFADTRFQVIHGHVADLLLEVGQIHGAVGFDAVVNRETDIQATAPKREGNRLEEGRETKRDGVEEGV